MKDKYYFRNKEKFWGILGDKRQKMKVFRPLFITFAGQKEKRLYEKDIVCVSREYLSESDGGVRDEGPGGKGRARGGVLY